MVQFGLHRKSLHKNLQKRLSRERSSTGTSGETPSSSLEVASDESSMSGHGSPNSSVAPTRRRGFHFPTISSNSTGDEEDALINTFLDGPARAKAAVIAIDFGTTNTGLAYGLTDDRRLRILRRKEPTCVLFDRQNYHLLEFGKAAQDMYRRSQAGQQLVASFFGAEQPAWNEKYIFIDQPIKMELYDAMSETDGVPLEEQTIPNVADNLTFKGVISAILRHLKNVALRDIAAKEDKIIDVADALWVVTVPSIWRESDKQFIRRCAHAAGMIQDEFSGDLVIALESECAAVYAEAVLAQTDPHPKHHLRPNDTVVCLDCGGGTVDLAAIRILQPEDDDDDEGDETHMAQLLPPTGLKLGAKDIDKRFFRFLGSILGQEALKMAWETPDARLELQDGWETVKMKLRPENFLPGGHRVRFLLEATLQELDLKLPELVSRFNHQARAKYKNKAIKIDYKRALTRASTTLLLPPELFKHCFDPIVDPIVELVNETITGRLGLPDVDHLILYGGLGGSCYLRDKINRAFASETLRVHVAHNPNLTVMKGAVKFGFSPRIIRSRRARMTVGVKVTLPFVRSKHNKKPHLSHKAYDTYHKEYYLRDAFQPFVRRGELVDVQREYSHAFEPASELVDKIKFDIYATPAEDCLYVTEDGCEKLATITIGIEKGDMRRVLVSLLFGYTEVVAKVISADGELLRRLPIVYYRDAETAVMTAVAAQDHFDATHRPLSFNPAFEAALLRRSQFPKQCNLTTYVEGTVIDEQHEDN